MRNALRTWMEKATADEKKALADAAGTTVGSLRQAAGGYKQDGGIDLRPEFAGRIEAGTITLQRPGLPHIPRDKLSSTCRVCQRTCK